MNESTQKDIGHGQALDVLGSVEAEQMNIENGGAAVIRTSKDIHITQGGAVAMIAGGDVSLNQAGAQWLIARGGINVREGGGVVMLTRDAHIEKGTIGVLLSRATTFSGESKVVLDTPQAVLFGLAFGTAYGLVSFFLRRLRGR